MKSFIILLLIAGLIAVSFSRTVIEKVNVRVLEPTIGKCVVKVNPGPPVTVDIDAEALINAKGLTIKFGAFSFMDGVYNEFMESETISVCDLPKSDHPLVSFMYREMSKAGNMTDACPVKKGSYYLHGFTIEESELPLALPPGSFKIEINGTIHEESKDTPLFISDIYFVEVQ